MNRRELLKTGFVGSAFLAAAYFFYFPSKQREVEGYTSIKEGDLSILKVLIPAVLAGTSGKDQVESSLKGIDFLLSSGPDSLKRDFRKAMDFLSYPPAKSLVGGIWEPWNSVSVEKASSLLLNWRHSRFQILRSSSQMLFLLIFSLWYSGPHSWSEIGYQGPPTL